MDTSPRPRLPILLTLLLVTLGLATLPQPASAAPLPDLTVTAVSMSRTTVVAGGSLTVRDTTRNAGTARAAASSTRYYLSTDRAFGRTDRVLGTRAVPLLRVGVRHSGSKAVVVAKATPARRYYVLACADALKRIRESREGNNCRATTGLLRVTAPPPPPPPPAETVFPLVANPVTVGSTLQSDRAVTQTAYPSFHNVISTTDAAGTAYTLTIPKDALLSAEDITMTPVASVSGMPLSGGLSAAVQLEPHGLMLLQPATLEITSPDLGPIAGQTPFLFSAGGTDFRQYPVAMPEAGDTADTVRVRLTHFSTSGVGQGTDADRGSLGDRPPLQSLAQLEALVAETLRAERESQQAGNPPNPEAMQRVVGLMNQYYDDILRARLQAAETDPQKAAQATAEAVGWMRQLALLSVVDSARIADAKARVERIWKYAMLFYWNRCVSQHDLNAIATLMGIARQAALFSWSWIEEAKDKAERCGQIELRFDSAISSSFYTSGSVSTHDGNSRWRVRSTTEVPWTGIGESSLPYTDFASTYRIDYHETAGDCGARWHLETGTTTTPGRITALVQLQLNPRILPPGIEPVLAKVRVLPGFSLSLPSPQPTETYSWESNSCQDTSGTDVRSNWLDNFARVRGGNRVLLFEVSAGGAGEVLATKTWNHTQGTGTGDTRLVESTTVELWHKPLT